MGPGTRAAGRRSGDPYDGRASVLREDDGWTAAGALRVGDRLATLEGQWVEVEAVGEEDTYEVVYNLRVSEYHTYFVGCDEWGFSVWRTMRTTRLRLRLPPPTRNGEPRIQK